MDAYVDAPAAVVERVIELDLSPEDLWAAVCDPTSWLADEGSLTIAPGGQGTLVDDGVVRRAVVEEVDAGRRLAFRWWSEGGDGTDESRVELTIATTPVTSVLTVRETRVAPVRASAVASAAVRSGTRWEVRLACLAFVFALAPALVRV